MLFWVRSALPLATEGTQECIWNLSYNDRRMAIELELAKYLEEEEVDMLINQFQVTADYDGSLSASEMTCVAVSMAWCVAGQGVV